MFTSFSLAKRVSHCIVARYIIALSSYSCTFQKKKEHKKSNKQTNKQTIKNKQNKTKSSNNNKKFANYFSIVVFLKALNSSIATHFWE